MFFFLLAAPPTAQPQAQLSYLGGSGVEGGQGSNDYNYGESTVLGPRHCARVGQESALVLLPPHPRGASTRAHSLFEIYGGGIMTLNELLQARTTSPSAMARSRYKQMRNTPITIPAMCG